MEDKTLRQRISEDVSRGLGSATKSVTRNMVDIVKPELMGLSNIIQSIIPMMGTIKGVFGFLSGGLSSLFRRKDKQLDIQSATQNTIHPTTSSRPDQQLATEEQLKSIKDILSSYFKTDKDKKEEQTDALQSINDHFDFQRKKDARTQKVKPIRRNPIGYLVAGLIGKMSGMFTGILGGLGLSGLGLSGAGAIGIGGTILLIVSIISSLLEFKKRFDTEIGDGSRGIESTKEGLKGLIIGFFKPVLKLSAGISDYLLSLFGYKDADSYKQSLQLLEFTINSVFGYFFKTLPEAFKQLGEDIKNTGKNFIDGVQDLELPSGEDIRTNFSNRISKMKITLGSMGDRIVSPFNKARDGVQDLELPSGESIKVDFSNQISKMKITLGDMWDKIISPFIKVRDGIQDLEMPSGESIKVDFSNQISKMKITLGSMGDRIVSPFNKARDGVQDLELPSGEDIRTNFSNQISKMKITLGDMWDKIISPFIKVRDGIQDLEMPSGESIKVDFSNQISKMKITLGSMGDRIVFPFIKVRDGIQDLEMPSGESIKVDFSNQISKMKITLGSMWDKIISPFIKVRDGIQDLEMPSGEDIKTTLGDIFDFNLKDEVVKLVKSIINIPKNIFNGIKNKIPIGEDIKSNINDIFDFNLKDEVVKLVKSIVNIPKNIFNGIKNQLPSGESIKSSLFGDGGYDTKPEPTKEFRNNENSQRKYNNQEREKQQEKQSSQEMFKKLNNRLDDLNKRLGDLNMLLKENTGQMNYMNLNNIIGGDAPKSRETEQDNPDQVEHFGLLLMNSNALGAP